MQKVDTFLNLAKNICSKFALLPDVQSIALGGSSVQGFSDNSTDIDLYVFSDTKIPLKSRRKIIHRFGTQKENLELTYWDLGDEWIDAKTGIEVDIMYWERSWIENTLEQVVSKHQASLGYTTCHWHTILNLEILFDRNSWLKKFQNRYRLPYPKELQKVIIEKNYPVLRDVIPSYYNQIKKALERKDRISINHRLAAMLASYFDILFAVNELPHPGEKRLLDHAVQNCRKCPQKMEEDIKSLFNVSDYGHVDVLRKLDILIDGLHELLISEDKI